MENLYSLLDLEASQSGLDATNLYFEQQQTINFEQLFLDYDENYINDDNIQSLFDIINEDPIAKRKNEQQGAGISPEKKKIKKIDESSLYKKKPYTSKKIRTESTPKFKHEKNVYDLDLNLDESQSFNDAIENIKSLFEQIHTDYIKPVAKNDQVKIVIDHDMFKAPIWLPYMNPDDLTPDMIYNTFDRIAQSYKLNDDSAQTSQRFTARVSVKKMPAGSGLDHGLDIPTNSFEEFLQNTRSVKCINNTDKLCLLRAVIIAVEYSKKDARSACRMHQNQNGRKMNAKLHEMCVLTDIWKGPCGLKEMKTIEDKIVDYQLMVVDSNCKISNEPI